MFLVALDGLVRLIPVYFLLYLTLGHFARSYYHTHTLIENTQFEKQLRHVQTSIGIDDQASSSSSYPVL